MPSATALVAATAALLAATAPSPLPLPTCAMGELIPNLLQKDGHHLEGFGEAADGDVAMLFVQAATGHWTLLRGVSEEGVVCVVVRGKGWTTPPPGTPTGEARSAS